MSKCVAGWLRMHLLKQLNEEARVTYENSVKGQRIAKLEQIFSGWIREYQLKSIPKEHREILEFYGSLKEMGTTRNVNKRNGRITTDIGYSSDTIEMNVRMMFLNGNLLGETPSHKLVDEIVIENGREWAEEWYELAYERKQFLLNYDQALKVMIRVGQTINSLLKVLPEAKKYIENRSDKAENDAADVISKLRDMA